MTDLDTWITLALATIAASGGWLAHKFGRLAHVEQQLARVEATNRRMWLYLREIVDHSYRHGIDPPPIPDDIFGEDP